MAKIGLFIFSLTPLFVFFQSLAIMDPLILSLTIVALFLLFEIARKPSLFNALLLGLVFGFSFWIKNTGIFTVIFIEVALLYLLSKTGKVKVNKILVAGVPILVGFFISLPLILRGDYWLLWFENSQFSLSFGELFRLPVTLWFYNIAYFLLTLFIYLTPLAFISFAFLFLGKKKISFALSREEKVLLILFLAFSISIILTAKTMRTKYFIGAAAPLLPLLAIGVCGFSDHFKKYAQTFKFLILLSLFFASAVLIIAPTTFFSMFGKSSIVANERDYAYSWSSGYGMRQAGDFAKSLAKPFGPPVVLALPATPASNLSFYLTKQKDLTKSLNIVLVPISSKKEFESLAPFEKSSDLYFMADSAIIPDELLGNLRLLKSFDKPGNEDFIGLYKVQFGESVNQ